MVFPVLRGARKPPTYGCDAHLYSRLRIGCSRSPPLLTTLSTHVLSQCPQAYENGGAPLKQVTLNHYNMIWRCWRYRILSPLRRLLLFLGQLVPVQVGAGHRRNGNEVRCATLLTLLDAKGGDQTDHLPFIRQSPGCDLVHNRCAICTVMAKKPV
jgi:hypothetical protein